jgi:hypothetical protein
MLYPSGKRSDYFHILKREDQGTTGVFRLDA